MSQTIELLSDDEGRGSPVTYSDKYTDDNSVASTCENGDDKGKLIRQHTEISELSDTDSCQPFISHDGAVGEACACGEYCVNMETMSKMEDVNMCQCEKCMELQNHAAILEGYEEDELRMQLEGDCQCENCLQLRHYLQHDQSQHLLHSEDECIHSVQLDSSLRAASGQQYQHIHHNPQWSGVGIADDEIEIIADPDYYNDNVFYIDPTVARSLLSNFLKKEKHPNLHIHVDTRTKRQRFIARAVMIISMTMFTVSALLVMVSLIMSDHIDDLGTYFIQWYLHCMCSYDFNRFLMWKLLVDVTSTTGPCQIEHAELHVHVYRYDSTTTCPGYIMSSLWALQSWATCNLQCSQKLKFR